MLGSKKNFLFALSILIGTIVGAGIFGIPYVVSKSGIIPGFFYFLILGAVFLLIHLFYGEIILRTKGRHHLPSLANLYLGKKGKILITFSTLIGLTGTLLAYIIIGGDFLKIVFSPYINAPALYFSLSFLLILSFFVFRGMKLIAPTEIVTNLVIFLFALPNINVQNFSLINLSDSFLPYGVILFSLIGFTAIPEIGGILKTTEERKNFRKVILFSFLIIISLYIFFTLTVVGVSGEMTSPDVFQGLLPFLGPGIIFWGALAAVVTLADSFLAIALYLRDTLVYDYKFSKLTAGLFTCGLPLILFLIGFRSFIGTIGFVGTIIGLIEGIIIILIFKKAKELGDRQPEYSLKIPAFLLYFLITLLLLGAVSQFV